MPRWTASAGVTLGASASASDSSGIATMTVTDAGPGPGPITIRASRIDDPAAGPFETAFDASPSGLALLDPDGVVLRANPALATLLGTDPALATGVTLADHEAFAGPAASAKCL